MVDWYSSVDQYNGRLVISTIVDWYSSVDQYKVYNGRLQ